MYFSVKFGATNALFVDFRQQTNEDRPNLCRGGPGGVPGGPNRRKNPLHISGKSMFEKSISSKFPPNFLQISPELWSRPDEKWSFLTPCGHRFFGPFLPPPPRPSLPRHADHPPPPHPCAPPP